MANHNPNHNPDNRAQSTVTGRAATTEEVAFRNGYVNGRSVERDRAVQYERQRANARANARANNGVATGLTISLLLVAVAGLFGAIAYSLTGPSDPAETTVETTPEAAPNGNTTIIDRTIERTQEIIPAPSEVNLPDVNITLPQGENPQPANTEGNPNTPEPETADTPAETAQ